MFGTLGIQEILIILVIGIIVFGVIRMPKILRFIGSGIKNYRRVKNTLKNPLDFDRFMDEEPQENQQYYGPNPNDPQSQQWGRGWSNQRPGGYSGPDQQGQWQGGPSHGQGTPGEPGQSGEQKPPERDSSDA